MIIPVKTLLGSYDIVLLKGAIKKAEEFLNLERKVLVVTDSGVPKDYSNTILSKCKEGYLFTFKNGEASKNQNTLFEILSELAKNNFTRTDCVVAVGGGVVGDISGLASSLYMRGIDFYNIPTTFLSQVDSSIGGKTAIDFLEYKNIVGSFYQPKKVLIDAEVLKTLPDRELYSGVAESVKMAACFDKELFYLIKDGDFKSNTEEIIYRSLLIKKKVVELDEKESGIRRVLNFGHTVGHAVESISGKLLHGECVAIGMVSVSKGKVKEELKEVLNKFKLPTSANIKAEVLSQKMQNDKKKDGEKITAVLCGEIGSYRLEKMDYSDFLKLLKED